jgi:hypothetical protein
MQSMHQERRRTTRHPLGRVAAIMFGQGQEHPCLVKDYSDGGVRLQPNGFEIPLTLRCCSRPTNQLEVAATKWFGALERTWVLNLLVPHPSLADTMPRRDSAAAGAEASSA